MTSVQRASRKVALSVQCRSWFDFNCNQGSDTTVSDRDRVFDHFPLFPNHLTVSSILYASFQSIFLTTLHASCTQVIDCERVWAQGLCLLSILTTFGILHSVTSLLTLRHVSRQNEEFSTQVGSRSTARRWSQTVCSQSSSFTRF